VRRTQRLLLGVAIVLVILSVLVIFANWNLVTAGLGYRPRLATTSALADAATPTHTATVPATATTSAPTTAATSTPSLNTPTPAATATAELTGTEQLLDADIVPARDSRALAERLRPGIGPVPAVVNPAPPTYHVGDKATFRVSNSDNREVFPITATLRLISQHCTMWVQDGVQVDEKALENAAKDFDDHIYPTVHQYFGSEWNPGVDDDPRVAILNARFTGAAGYYASGDEFSHLVYPYSNEREMFYMSLNSTEPGDSSYDAILAHEFQHMVHWHLDPNEDSWVNEGASELSARLCGYGVTGAVDSFALQPDTQLNAWALSPDEDTLPHYGASYLWMDYFLQRMGPAALKAVETDQANGIAGFEDVLSKIQGAPSFDDLFADWVVANLLDNRTYGGGRYGHDFANPHMTIERAERTFPSQEKSTVHQYGTDYVTIQPSRRPLRLDFSGSTVVSVVPNTPFQGSYEWWANRGDMSDSTLTRAFDLTHVQRATLQYALWYELEDGWDYAYVEVSTDNGRTWKPLKTSHTTDYDPNGNAFGPGYTGFSGHPSGSTTNLIPQWIQEKVDLTPYAGKNILLRFEQITDDAVNLPGMCLDNISIPELGYLDNAENANGGWQAAGFVRMDNKLPQKYLVQVIYPGSQPEVDRVELDAHEQGSIIIKAQQRATLAISGLTRNTTETAAYSYTLTPVDQ